VTADEHTLQDCRETAVLVLCDECREYHKFTVRGFFVCQQNPRPPWQRQAPQFANARGTNSEIAAADQIRPVASTMPRLIQAAVHISKPSISFFGFDIGLAWISPSERELVHPAGCSARAFLTRERWQLPNQRHLVAARSVQAPIRTGATRRAIHYAEPDNRLSPGQAGRRCHRGFRPSLSHGRP
jgi:hypothetical protein